MDWISKVDLLKEDQIRALAPILFIKSGDPLNSKNVGFRLTLLYVQIIPKGINTALFCNKMFLSNFLLL